MFRTQLLTAQRPGEVSRMRWAQLEPALFQRTADGLALPSKLDPVVWTIPGKETKKRLAHEVPLSGAVIELLRDLATRDEKERIKINTLYRAKKHHPARDASEYVFPSRTRKGPIKEVQKAVQRLRSAAGSSSSRTIFVGPRRR
jgi:integrase